LKTALSEFLPEFGPSLVSGQYIFSAFDKKQAQNENVPCAAIILLKDVISENNSNIFPWVKIIF
jgi:hypothetical protein